MIFSHRINTAEQLAQVAPEYGVEIDIRTRGEDLVLAHDPFVSGESLEEWLNSYRHSGLILNVKEDGLERRLTGLMDQFGIRNYFFLDVQFPTLVKCVKERITGLSVRISAYESLDKVTSLLESINWVWVDAIEGLHLRRSDLEIVERFKLNTCLVSPELVSGDRSQIQQFKKKLTDLAFKPTAICTKSPTDWLDFF